MIMIRNGNNALSFLCKTGFNNYRKYYCIILKINHYCRNNYQLKMTKKYN